MSVERSRLRRRPRNRWWNCVLYKHMLIHTKLQTGKRGQKTELTGRRPLRRRRSALDCRIIEEEKEQQERRRRKEKEEERRKRNKEERRRKKERKKKEEKEERRRKKMIMTTMMMMISMEHWWNDTDRGKPKYWEKTLPHGHSVHHKSHVTRPGMEARSPR